MHNITIFIIVGIAASVLCRAQFSQTPINPLNPVKDGVYMTSHGPIKVLFVMVEFPDDAWHGNDAFWPVAGQGQPFWEMEFLSPAVDRPRINPVFAYRNCQTMLFYFLQNELLLLIRKLVFQGHLIPLLYDISKVESLSNYLRV